MKHKIMLCVVIVLGLLLIAGCSQQVNNETEDNLPEDEVQLTGETKEFEITAKNWEFVPDTITVNLGDMVDIHVTSIDVTHGFYLPAFGINTRLEPNQEEDIEFIADKKGTFSFSCSVPCGSGHGGMSGQLIVK